MKTLAWFPLLLLLLGFRILRLLGRSSHGDGAAAGAVEGWVRRRRVLRARAVAAPPRSPPQRLLPPLHLVRPQVPPWPLLLLLLRPPRPSSFAAAAAAPTTAAAAASAETLVHCSKCPSVAHRACLAAADLAAQFLCPSCKNPEGFSYLPVPGDPPKGKGSGESDRPPINRPSAKVFLAAAQLSATSMSKAAAAARADAERKVKEAAVAKKRAREMLEGLLVIAKREEKMNGAKGSVTPIPVPAQEAAEPKKKAPRPSSTVSAQKKVQSREERSG
uniref:Zinc finger PHD-type domain-containing protein n=1 Tax=Ananas comosus var. bracteatus TaxID=296719 RepID=A0A6V7PSG0_ANACO|nr:unnamed protein product [Ananas comosus var. bracteatus]